MIIGTGIDIIEIERVKNAIEKNPSFIQRFFTPQEYAYFRSRKMRYEVIAGNFAAKEAFSKAMGTGIREFELKEVEILRDELGKPYLCLYGKAHDLMQKLGVERFHISISHCRGYAVANVIAERF